MSLKLNCSNNDCVWFGEAKDLQVNNSVTMYYYFTCIQIRRVVLIFASHAYILTFVR